MLKGTSQAICSPLSDNFNVSFSSGLVPLEWKSSRVIPVHKADDPSDVANYRPISLLSLVAKVQERIVHNAVMDHALSNELLSFSQYVFRPGSSTQEAILAATRDWHQTLECGENVACVFLDLSKAFDSLPHSLILRSLSRVGVCGKLFDLFANYLTGRSQWVALKGVSSASVMVTSGVPVLNT